MKHLILLLLLASLLSACKKKCDSCGPNQQCVDGVCQCKQWYEGANCDTAMIIKFDGTFIGLTYTNSANPVTDTFTFYEYIFQPNFADLQNTDLLVGKKQQANLSITSATTADYMQTYGPIPQIFVGQKKCGTVRISENGRDLTIIFSPVSIYGIIDSNTLYTFIGTKQ
ncbi:MAG: hypothetical protein JST83_03430 [Bacteroidetes bacterium]|nr:hypothetical protein [Bacteroidota bacterium]